jgi:uncharacterized protein YndB with AHSA1/START domain
MNEPDTCGQGLAERSVLPEKLAELAAAMAANLEQHQRTLDVTGHNARAEHEACEVVASALRNAAAQLQAAADRMAGYRDLPMAWHDERALTSPEIRDTFARFIDREHELSALLDICIQQDRNMLGDPSARAGSSAPATTSRDAESIVLTRVPVTETGILIRKPVRDVFEAIVNPEITTKFWFTKGSGRLEAGQRVRWDWEMYDVSIDVQAIEPNRRIMIQWPGYSGPTTVEWTFAAQKDGTTFVRVTESGFTGTGDQLAKYVADLTQGFTLMLVGLKALLEHGVQLNLTGDRYPKGVDEQQITKSWRGHWPGTATTQIEIDVAAILIDNLEVKQPSRSHRPEVSSMRNPRSVIRTAVALSSPEFVIRRRPS